MRLNHINLPVSDLGASHAFLKKYFGLQPLGAPGEGSVAVLIDESGSIVTLSRFDVADTVKYPGAFHIGFVQSSKADVDTLNQQLLSDGYTVGEPKELHGRYTFYVKAPGGFTIEVLGPMAGL